jgi:hypothetical protein
MNVIITYDLTGAHGPVKTTMIENGYSKTFITNGVNINLPETTLFHRTKTPAQALEDLVKASNLHGVKVTRAIALERDGIVWRAFPGEFR